MELLKLNILSCIILPIALVTLSAPALAQVPDADTTVIPDSLHPVTNDNEGFILTSDNATLFPSFFLIDTTLSTIVVDEGLSIQVELRKVDFLGKDKQYKQKDHIRPLPLKDMAMMPRRKAAVIPSKISLVKITL